MWWNGQLSHNLLEENILFPFVSREPISQDQQITGSAEGCITSHDLQIILEMTSKLFRRNSA